jgi:hypothetical protein
MALGTVDQLHVGHSRLVRPTSGWPIIEKDWRSRLRTAVIEEASIARASVTARRSSIVDGAGDRLAILDDGDGGAETILAFDEGCAIDRIDDEHARLRAVNWGILAS